MLDLAKELREDAAFAEGGEFPEDACRWAITMRQAADEIERLREELAQLKDGRMAILPSSRKHALDLLTVAEAGLRSFPT